MIAIVASVALILVTGASALVVSFVFRDARTRDRAWEKKETAWAQERQQLLDRVMYLADKPWDMPAQDIEEVPESTSYDPTMQPIDTGDFDYHYNPAGVV